MPLTHPKAAASRGLVSKVFDTLLHAVVGVRDGANSRLDNLEQRVAKLEALPRGLEYKAVWRPETEYVRHDAVTESGSLWIAIRDHPGQPGDPESGWILAAKRGRDARDLR